MEQIKEISFAEVAAEQKVHMIDLRPHFNFFELPDEAAIGAAIHSIFPSDPALASKPMTGKMLGCYRISATTEPNQPAIHLPRKVRDSTDVETISIPLQRYRTSGVERREGTLVTIVDGDFGRARAIPGREFDVALGQFGEVVMTTRPQVNKVTNMLNNNRMAVVDTSNATNPLPNRLIIGEHSFLLKYKGKKWFCSSCNEEHIGPCPYLKSFYEALERKRAMKVDTLVLADSTLRLAENVGVKADITCMPGATVGQLAQVIEELPEGKYDSFYIAAGANDTNIRDETCPFTIAKKIDASLKKLLTVAEKRKDSIAFSFFDSTSPKAQKSPIQQFTDLYFKKRIRKVLRKEIFHVKSI